MFESNKNSSDLWEKISNRHSQKKHWWDNANNNISVTPMNNNQNNTSLDTSEDRNSAIKGGSNLFNAIKGNNSTSSNGSGLFSSLFGNNSSGSAISDSINSYVNSGSGGASSSGGGTPWALIGALGKAGYNGITGHDDKDYSDTEESIIYPLQGASMGAQWGPWGALGGALYGLGYSLKDDIGLKDSNFMTKALFPIDMGGDYADWL